MKPLLLATVCQRSPESSTWHRFYTQSNRSNYCDDRETLQSLNTPKCCHFCCGRKPSMRSPCSPLSLPHVFTMKLAATVPVKFMGHFVWCGHAVMGKASGQPFTPLMFTGEINLDFLVSKVAACLETETTAPLRTIQSDSWRAPRRLWEGAELCYSTCLNTAFVSVKKPAQHLSALC